MLYRRGNIAGVPKQTVKIVPISCQTALTQGQNITVTLPPNALVDLSTFDMKYKGETRHGENSADWETSGGTATNVKNYCGKLCFPRNTSKYNSKFSIRYNK
jgi:hypothetical protein